MRLQRSAALVLTLLVTGLSSIAAQAADAPPAAITADFQSNNPSLGYWLEDQLGQMMSNCAPGQTLQISIGWPFTHKQTVSAVSGEIRSALLNTPSKVYVLLPSAAAGADLTRMFSRVYSTNNITTAAQVGSDFDIDFTIDTDQVTAPGISGSIYSSSCASVVSAALGTNAQYSIPLITVKAALDSTYGTTAKFRVDLADGQFFSPVKQSYDGLVYGATSDSAAAIARLSSRLVMWEWYEDNNSLIPPGKLYIIDNFFGDAVYKKYGFTIQSKVDVSANGALSYVGIGVNGSGSVNLSNSQSIAGQSYGVAIKIDPGTGPRLTFAELPNAGTLSADLDTLRPFNVLSSKQPAFPGDSRVSTQEIPAFPLRYCATGEWTLSDDLGGALTFQVTPAGQVSAAPFAAYRSIKCDFVFTFTPVNATQVKGGLAVDAVLTRSMTLAGATYQAKLHAAEFAIPPSNFVLTQQALPGAIVPTADPAVAGNSILAWSSAWNLADKSYISGPSQVDASGLVLSCTDPTVSVTQPAAVVSLPGLGPAVRTLTIKWNMSVAGMPASLTASTKKAACAMKGGIIFTINPGTPTQQSLTYQVADQPIQYPYQ